MKKMNFISLCFITLVTMPLYAIMPQQGLYGGVLFGFSWSSPIANPMGFPFVNDDLQRDGPISKLIKRIISDKFNSTSFKLEYSVLGQIGGQIGYRFDNIRLEGEFFYNVSPYRKLKIDGLTREFEISANNNLSNYITGETDTAAGMLNIYYDFLQLPSKWISITPFVGIGGGYANVTNNLQIYANGNLLNNTPISPSSAHFAGQLMTGLLYFIDEFSTIGLDYRYFTTASQTMTVAGHDSTFKNQIQSVNLTYNGSFNFG